MIGRKTFALFLCVLLSAACYHATVDTGRAPNGVTVEKKWAHSFIAGLVPPSVVETAARCPDGIATVETRLSFLNQVASFVTFGIYSPMEITVACAGGTASLGTGDDVVNAEPGEVGAGKALQQAVERTTATGETVYVRF